MAYEDVNVKALREVIKNLKSELYVIKKSYSGILYDLTPGSFWVCNTKKVIKNKCENTVREIAGIINFLDSEQVELNRIERIQEKQKKEKKQESENITPVKNNYIGASNCSIRG